MNCRFLLYFLIFIFTPALVYSAPVTTIVNQPSGVPVNFVNSTKPTSTTSQYTAIENIDNNILILNQEFIYQKAMLDYIASSVENVALISTVSALDAKVTALDAKVAQMDPSVITQSISFLIGAFIAMAFVISSKFRN